MLAISFGMIHYVQTDNRGVIKMANSSERRNFIKDVIADDLLDMAIDWVKSNMEPAEVFDESQLKEWAEYNDYVKAED